MNATAKVQIRTIEDLVLACSRLRAAVGAAEVNLYEFLRLAEDQHRNLWEAKYPTFSRFLEGEQICSAGRYTAYTKAVDAIGIARVRRIGVDAAQVLPKIPTGKHEAVVIALNAWCDQHQGRLPKIATARIIAQQIHPVVAEPHVITRMNELVKLRRENEQLRQEVAALKKKLRELQAKG